MSDETGSHQLYWNDLRITGGENPLAFGANNSGKGVGGGSVHWAAFTPRFHPSRLRGLHAGRRRGGLADVVLGPEAILRTAGAARCRWPGRPGIRGAIRTAIPTGRIRWAASATCSSEAARRWASASAPAARWRFCRGSRADRPHCIYRGFCIQGCKVGAKASTLITHVPDAIAHGAEIRDRSHGRRASHLGRRQPRHRRQLFRSRRARAVSESEGRHRLRLRDRDAAAAAQLRLRRLRERPGQLQRHASAAT